MSKALLYKSYSLSAAKEYKIHNKLLKFLVLEIGSVKFSVAVYEKSIYYYTIVFHALSDGLQPLTETGFFVHYFTEINFDDLKSFVLDFVSKSGVGTYQPTLFGSDYVNECFIDCNSEGF